MRTVMSMRTNLRNIVQNPDEWVAILVRIVMLLPPSTHIGRPPTSRTHGTRVTCISSSLRLSWSPGRGSAAVPSRMICLIQKRARFPRKQIVMLLSQSTHIERPPTFKKPRTRVLEERGGPVLCISSSLRLSGSSGRGSAAARIRLVQKRTRFARKPLMKTH
jgi:hypothetical protein